MFAATEVGEVWGIGPRIAAQLQQQGIQTVLDATRLDPAMVRSRWSVVLERTIRELQGQPCITLEEAPPPKKQIACTRSFGWAVTQLQPMLEAISEFASRGGEKLRRERAKCSQVLVFAHTSPFRPGRSYSRSITLSLRRPTASSLELVATAVRGRNAIYRPGFDFAKAGVMLLDLLPEGQGQGELELDGDAEASAPLMQALDAINNRYGKGAVRLASAGAQTKQREWDMRQELRTPRYTTRWDEIPVARA